MRLRRKVNISYYAALLALLTSLASTFLGGGSGETSRSKETVSPRATVPGAPESHVGLGADEQKPPALEALRKEVDQLRERLDGQGEVLSQMRLVQAAQDDRLRERLNGQEEVLSQMRLLQAAQDDQIYMDFTFAGPERIALWHSSATKYLESVLKELPNIKKNIMDNVRERIGVLDEYESRIELRDQDFNVLVTKIVTEELRRGIDTPISGALAECRNEAELTRKMLKLTNITQLEQGCASLFEPFFSMVDLGSVGDISLFESTSLKIANDAIEFVPVVGDVISITSYFFNARLEYSVFGKTDGFIEEVVDNAGEEISQRLDDFLTARQYYEMLRMDSLESSLKRQASQTKDQLKTRKMMEH